MRRTRVRWGRVGGLAASVVLAVGLASNVANAVGSYAPPAPVRAYVVRSGDTLWAIAARVAGPTADPRPLVDRIAAANHLAGPIVAGQTLLIPLP